MLAELGQILRLQLPFDTAPTGVAYDSRKVEVGDLYVALAGRHVHGMSFEAEAAQRGAVAVLSDRIGSVLPAIVVADPRAVLGPVAAAIHGRPSHHMNVVGITGTNGKTTTAFLTQYLLGRAGVSAGRITTIDVAWDGAGVPSTLTTPEAPDLQAALATMVKAGCESAVVEVSSHGLAMSRVDGISFGVGVFTNLGRDHFDFHADRAAYLACKASLFRRERCEIGVVNIDDPAGRDVAEMATCPVVTLSATGSSTADWRVTRAEPGSASTRFEVAGPCGSFEAVMPMAGRHNLENCLASLAACHYAGVDVPSVAATLARFPGVPGRLERVEAGQSFAAMVDFAHNPEALTAVLEAVRGGVGGRVIVVIGAPGDRDAGKRPLMRQAAMAAADVVIVTTDDPYGEDPYRIIADVMDGADPDGGAALLVEPDRARAIRLAVRMAGDDDAVLVTGRGHETVQTVGTSRILFDDRQELGRAVREAVARVV